MKTRKRKRGDGLDHADHGEHRLAQARAPEGQDPERDRHRDREGQGHADELEVLRRAPQDPDRESDSRGCGSLRSPPLTDFYTPCARKGWAEDALAYNELIAAWSGIETASHEVRHIGSQTTLDIMRRLSCTSNVSISK